MVKTVENKSQIVPGGLGTVLVDTSPRNGSTQRLVLSEPVEIIGASGVIYHSVVVSDPHLGKADVLPVGQSANPITVE